jgi:hypothetical protein
LENLKIQWASPYEAERKKQIATPKKNVEKTTMSPRWALAYRGYTVL